MEPPNSPPPVYEPEIAVLADSRAVGPSVYSEARERLQRFTLAVVVLQDVPFIVCTFLMLGFRETIEFAVFNMLFTISFDAFLVYTAYTGNRVALNVAKIVSAIIASLAGLACFLYVGLAALLLMAQQTVHLGVLTLRTSESYFKTEWNADNGTKMVLDFTTGTQVAISLTFALFMAYFAFLCAIRYELTNAVLKSPEPRTVSDSTAIIKLI